jgi:hypothetical protein
MSEYNYLFEIKTHLAKVPIADIYIDASSQTGFVTNVDGRKLHVWE